MRFKPNGVGVPLAIPFHRHGTVDFSSLEKIIERAILSNVDYLAILNNFRESNTLSNDEKLAILNFTIDIVDKRLPVVAGISGNNTQALIDILKKSDIQGIDAIIPFCPYITRVKQKGIFNHYKEIAAVSSVPVIIYNTNLGTDNIINPETVLELANGFHNIAGYIEDYPSMKNLFSILHNKPEDFKIIMGDDMNIVPAMSIGADSLMPMIANPFPERIKEVFQLCSSNNYDKARDVFSPLIPIIEILQRDDKISGIKAILDIQKICSNNLRLPLVKLKKNLLYSLQELIKMNEEYKVCV
jgi:4-hydroxy-tetrahydrodipicolinate synthase